MNIISKLDNEPNDVGGLTAGELKGKFDEAGLAIQKYINEVLLPGAENSDNIMVGGDTLTNVLNTIKAAAAALLEDYNRHAADRENPHAVTKAQVGLGRADNTPDTEKPVSEKQQAALDLKADKEFVILKGAGIEYTPTAAADPANKGYVDQTVAGVTLGKIPDNSLTTEKYKNKSITKEKLADDAMDTYTRAESLSTENKKEFGLVNAAIPNDVFSILKKAVIYEPGNLGLVQSKYGPTGIKETAYIRDIAAGNNVLVAGGSSEAFYFSKNGGETFSSVPTSWKTKSLAFGNGVFVRIRDVDSAVADYSHDGETWMESNLPVSATWSLVRFLNNAFYAFAKSYVAKSDDGINWVSCECGTMNEAPAGAAYLETAEWKYVTISYSGYKLRSKDGLQWSESSGSPTSDIGWSDIAASDHAFVRVGATNKIVSVSSDGVSWADQKNYFSGNRVVFKNGMFVAIGADGVWNSPDGKAWRNRSVNENVAHKLLTCLDDGTFYLMTYGATHYYYFTIADFYQQFTDVLGHPANICRFGTGRYIGTGTYGELNPNSLTFDFEPKLVIITGVDKTVEDTKLFYSGTMFYLWGAATANVCFNRAAFGFGNYQEQVAFGNNVVSVEGKTMKWWAGSSRSQQCNDTTAVYGWIAIG